MSVQREKGDSWREIVNLILTISCIKVHGKQVLLRQNNKITAIIEVLENCALRWFLPIPKLSRKSRAFPLRRLGTPLTFLWTFLVFNFNSTFLEGRGLGVINKWAQNRTHFIPSSARWSPATIEILTVRRILEKILGRRFSRTYKWRTESLEHDT